MRDRGRWAETMSAYRPSRVPGEPHSPRPAQANDVSTIDPTPAFGFGHGLGDTTFTWSDLTVGTQQAATEGEFTIAFTLRNAGERTGTEVVRLYLHDPTASVVQPVQRLVGYSRVSLAPGETRRIDVTVPADVASFTGRDGGHIVEPGDLELRLASSSTTAHLTTVTLTGPSVPWTRPTDSTPPPSSRPCTRSTRTSRGRGVAPAHPRVTAMR